MSSLATPGSYASAVPKGSSVSQFTPLWTPYATAGVGPTGPAGPSSGATGATGPTGPSGLPGSSVPGRLGVTGPTGSAFGFSTSIFSQQVTIPFGGTYSIATSTFPVGPYVVSIQSSNAAYRQTNLTAPFAKTTNSGIRGGGSTFAPNFGGMYASADNADTVQPTKIVIGNNTNTANRNFLVTVYQVGVN
jgi:hypothetical protein